METLIELVLILGAAAVAFVVGYLIQRNFASAQIKAQIAEAQKTLAQAEARAKDIVLKAKD